MTMNCYRLFILHSGRFDLRSCHVVLGTRNRHVCQFDRRHELDRVALAGWIFHWRLARRRLVLTKRSREKRGSNRLQKKTAWSPTCATLPRSGQDESSYLRVSGV